MPLHGTSGHTFLPKCTVYRDTSSTQTGVYWRTKEAVFTTLINERLFDLSARIRGCLNGVTLHGVVLLPNMR